MKQPALRNIHQTSSSFTTFISKEMHSPRALRKWCLLLTEELRAPCHPVTNDLELV